MFSAHVILFLYFFVLRYKYDYPSFAFGWEVTFVILLTVIDFVRMHVCTRGNKLEDISSLAWALVLSIPMIVGYSFFLDLQTYM